MKGREKEYVESMNSTEFNVTGKQASRERVAGMDRKKMHWAQHKQEFSVNLNVMRSH